MPCHRAAVSSQQSVLVSDILFLVSLTSTVCIVSELKKLLERQVEKRPRSIKSDLDFV
jgi:Ca2+-transporting ATPase